jgi:hypothetical protein
MRVNPVLFFQRRWQWLRWGAPAAVAIGGLIGWWVVAWQADAKGDTVAAAPPARATAASAPARSTTHQPMRPPIATAAGAPQRSHCQRR